jgi:hypothetical protein
MAIDKAPGGPDDFWSEFVQEHTDHNPAKAPAAPTPFDGLDVDALTRIIGQSQQVTTQITASNESRIPWWARTDPAKVAYWSVIAPTLVSGCANLSAHQWPGWEVPFTGGLVSALALFLTVGGLNKHWNPAATAVTTGITVGALQFATAAGSGGWMEIVAWLTGAVGTMGFSILWNRKHAGDRAKVELTKAKTDTERAKRDAVQVMSQVKAAHELLKIEATRKAAIEERPYLGGITGEERAIRKAVWEVHEEQLLTCDVTMTRTGWTAVIGLPSALSRDAARTSWPKVASAMRLDGRMKAADGQRTNELTISFVDNSKTGLESLTGWHPSASWAVVADTGDSVPVPLGRRILFAGCSGSGKSWSARPLMAEASEYDDHRLVVIDLKVTEARNWQHRARIATEVDQIDQVTTELIEEGERRLKLIPRGRDTVEISPDMPRLTVFVDEGGELLSALEEDVIERLRTIARKYRAAELILVWATQKPSLSGNGHGLDSQISAQLTHKLSLTAATPNESRVIFGEDAGDKGWDAHDLPLKGWALLRDIETQAAPARLRMRAMSPSDVIALPDRPVWFKDGDRWFSGDEQYQELCASSPSETSDEDRAQKMRDGGMSVRQVADATGRSKSWVDRNTVAPAE